MTEQLDSYREKRDFAATPEPPDAVPEGRAGPLTFVVQKHDATRLHYDLRLEVGGVMKSWAVPRGPSSDPAVRRHAVMTEDHPIGYSAFEGVIPRGQYGAGQVIVWDAGTYAPEHDRVFDFSSREEAEAAMEAAIAAGKISFQMRGRKLKGSWALVKTSTDWLLLKHDDPLADPEADLTAADRSVVSDLSLDDIRGGRLPRHRSAPSDYTPDALNGSQAAPPPDSLVPMMASVRDPFSHPDWLFEPKLDGIRAVAHVSGGEARLYSRRGTDLTAAYPGLVAALAAQPVAEAIFDGEIVAFDERGVPSFELLQQRMNLGGELDIAAAEARVPVTYMAFDLLHLDGFNLTGVALEERKESLARVLLPVGPVALVEHFQAEGKEAYEGAVALGLEGVVAKRRGSRYLPGKRSDAWAKIKDRRTAEFVVAGFTPGEGARESTFGALLLGARDPDGALVYRGRAGGGLQRCAARGTPCDARCPRHRHLPLPRNTPRRRRRHLCPPRARRRGRVLRGHLSGPPARPRLQAPPPRQGPRGGRLRGGDARPSPGATRNPVPGEPGSLGPAPAQRPPRRAPPRRGRPRSPRHEPGEAPLARARRPACGHQARPASLPRDRRAPHAPPTCATASSPSPATPTA